jgi:16S rRNA (cytosine967-C5)-methyltransferase
LIKKIQAAWPTWKNILAANNEHPPQCLRINQRKISRQAYLEELARQNIQAEVLTHTQSGIRLIKPMDITLLPGFVKGWVSIQDGSAQLAAELLMPGTNDRILDACAAPGGKTCHILELQPTLSELVALDNDSRRLERLQQNLDRLGLSARIVSEDVTHLDWWDGKLFDRILLDAPCTATGVIRRHPDIKLLRTPADIPLLTHIQLQALTTLWHTLKPGGTLLYVTCSILPEENWQLIQNFMTKQATCKVQEINADWGMAVKIGRQILPGMHKGMDGFYFAKLIKT